MVTASHIRCLKSVTGARTMMDVRNNIQYYLEQLMFGMGFKAIISAILLFFTDFLYGDTVVLGIYFAVVAIDLALGLARACLYGVFRYKILLHWVYKVFTHIFLVVLLGLVCHSMHNTVGLILPVVNWLLLCCTITETVSIIYNLKRLGCPVPAIVDKVLTVIRKNAARKIASAMDAPGLQGDIENILSERRMADENSGEVCDRTSGDNTAMESCRAENRSERESTVDK